MTDEREIPTEYENVEKHTHKGIRFFTAHYGKHVVLEPLQESIRKVLKEYSDLWADSSHTWARGMPLREQRSRLIYWAREEIDQVLSGEELSEMVNDDIEIFIIKRARFIERQEIFTRLAKEREE